MNDANKNTDHDEGKVMTPLVAPHDRSATDEAPAAVDTDAPVSTDAKGDVVDLPDLGGKID